MPLPSAIEDIFHTKSLPSLGPEQRSGTLNINDCQDKIGHALGFTNIQRENLIRSALLLWHDHLEASHTISQSINTDNGSFLHSLVHRREPDYPNAKYWLNQTGQHKAYPEITKRSRKILKDTPSLNLIISEWNPYEMVDCVQQSKVNTDEYKALQELQRVEMEVFLEMNCS